MAQRRLDSTRLRVIVAATVGNMVSITPAVASVFGLFLIPLATTFGWPRAAVSGVFGVVAIASALMMPLVGRLADRFGVQRMAILGNLAFAASIGALAFTTKSLVQFYITFAVIAVAATFASPPMLSKVVSEWFDSRRGAMLGISAGFGNGFGSMLIPVIAATAMPHVGWRGAYGVIAAIVAGLGFPAYALLRDAPRRTVNVDVQQGEGMSVRETMATRSFWLLLVALASAAGCMTAVFSHMVPILAERHIGVVTATAVLGVYAMTAAAWQIALGFGLDRVSSPHILVPMYLSSVAGIALLELGRGTLALLGSGILLGIGLATQYSSMPYLIARYFGLRSFGAIIGVCYSVVYLMQGATPVLLDHGFDVQQTYRGMLTIICVWLCVGAGMIICLPRFRGAAVIAAVAIHH